MCEILVRVLLLLSRWGGICDIAALETVKGLEDALAYTSHAQRFGIEKRIEYPLVCRCCSYETEKYR